MTQCFCINYTSQDESSAYFPTTVSIYLGTNYLIYTSSVSRPDFIKALSVSATNTPTSTPVKSPKSNTVSVRKNDVYSTQPLRTLSSLQTGDKTVNLSGVLVKVMDIQRCSGGDYKRNIYIVDETMQTPFLVSVFFKEAADGDVFSVLGSPVFFSTLRISSYRDCFSGVASASYTGVTVFNVVTNEFDSIHDCIDPKSVTNRCNELNVWFMNLSPAVLSQVTKQQYARFLGTAEEDDAFDAIVKVVDFEPIEQEFVSSLQCFDSSLVYLSSTHSVRIQISAQLHCAPYFNRNESLPAIKFFNLIKRNEVIQYTQRSSFLILPPECSLSLELRRQWKLVTRIPPSLEPLCRAPRTESIPHVLLCNLRQAGEVVVRCSVQRVESVEPERLVIRVTDGTDDRSVSIGEDCLSLFANVHSLSELGELLGSHRYTLELLLSVESPARDAVSVVKSH
ncbi:hypothetical protein WA588_003969 [Blastocystis sp. NMH]